MVFSGKGVLKICSKCTGEQHVKLLCNFIEITLRHGGSPVNLLYIFKKPFRKNNSGELLLNRRLSFSFFGQIRWNKKSHKDISGKFYFDKKINVKAVTLECAKKLHFRKTLSTSTMKHFRKTFYLRCFVGF